MKNYIKYPCKISYSHYVREEQTVYFTELKIQKSSHKPCVAICELCSWRMLTIIFLLLSV